LWLSAVRCRPMPARPRQTQTDPAEWGRPMPARPRPTLTDPAAWGAAWEGRDARKAPELAWYSTSSLLAELGERSRCRDTRRKLVFFDFDHTLTVMHLFKSLACLGWGQEPAALSERGQVKKLFSLGSAWIQAAFGGVQRIAKVRTLLQRISSEHDLVVLTRGYVGVVRKCLGDLGLLGFFREVHGHIGETYGVTPYDMKAREQGAATPGMQQCLGAEGAGNWVSKVEIVAMYCKVGRLPASQVIYVDDDSEEVEQMKTLATTITVPQEGRQEYGFGRDQAKQLLALLNIEVEEFISKHESWAAAASSAGRPTGDDSSCRTAQRCGWTSRRNEERPRNTGPRALGAAGGEPQA